MFPEMQDGEMKDVLHKFVPNYWMNLVDAGEIERVEHFRTDLQ